MTTNIMSEVIMLYAIHCCTKLRVLVISYVNNAFSLKIKHTKYLNPLQE